MEIYGNEIWEIKEYLCLFQILLVSQMNMIKSLY